MTVRQKIGLVTTIGTSRLLTCPLYSHQHPFSSIQRACMGCIAFLINISPYFCSLLPFFPMSAAFYYQHDCREYGSTLSVIGMFSWAVDEMIEMTCMFTDVTMQNSSLVWTQLQCFFNGTGPHQWSLNGPFAVSSWGELSIHTHCFLIRK